MKQLRRQSPALPIAFVALFLALAGGVYAAAERIDGKRIAAKSLPGNRLAPASVPGNRLAPGSVPGNRLRPGSVTADRIAPGSLTGAQIDTDDFDQVPRAALAGTADRARVADRAVVAESAETATDLSGFRAGCEGEMIEFGGACWDKKAWEPPASAPLAARLCAQAGGELPGALALAAFGAEPGIALAVGGEWSSDVADFLTSTIYSGIAVTPARALVAADPNTDLQFRCVFPFLR